MREINIIGSIVSNTHHRVYDFLGMQSFCPKMLVQALEKSKGQPVTVTISSPGGDLYAGIEMFGLLKNYKGKVTIQIISLAASAASVIAMGGDEVLMYPGAQLMIHNVSTTVSGNSQDLEHVKNILDTSNESLAAIYKYKTGKPINEILELMKSETFFTADNAVKEGFADKVLYVSKQEEAQKKLEKMRLKMKVGGA